MTSSENPNNEHKEYKRILYGLIMCNFLWYILSLIIIFTNLWTKTLARPVAILAQTTIANATARLNTPSTEIRKTTVTTINIDNLYWQCLFLEQSRWETRLFFHFYFGNYWEILGIIENYWEILGIIGKVSCAIVVPLHPILRFKLLLHLSKWFLFTRTNVESACFCFFYLANTSFSIRKLTIISNAKLNFD